MSLYIWVNRLSGAPTRTTWALTEAAVCPVAVTPKVAVAPTAASPVAVTVTVWPVLQLDGVKVSDAGAADTAVDPALRATATVTLAVGALDSDTLNVPVPLVGTDTKVESVTIDGVVAASTKTGTAAVLLLLPAASY